MNEPPVKANPTRAPRPYKSPKRERRAQETRRRIRDAATTLFLRDGYAVTTMSAIARAAEVGERTVYLAFPTKAALLGEIITVAVRGGDEDAPLADRDAWQEVLAAPGDQILSRLAAGGRGDPRPHRADPRGRGGRRRGRPAARGATRARAAQHPRGLSRRRAGPRPRRRARRGGHARGRRRHDLRARRPRRLSPAHARVRLERSALRRVADRHARSVVDVGLARDPPLEDVSNVERRRLLELRVAAGGGVAVRAPAHELRRVPEPRALQVVVAHLDDPLRAAAARMAGPSWGSIGFRPRAPLLSRPPSSTGARRRRPPAAGARRTARAGVPSGTRRSRRPGPVR